MNNTIKEIGKCIYNSVNNAFDNMQYELYEMAACGHIDDLYLIIFMNDGGNIPHFHVYNNPNPKKSTFDACLKIETPEYFKHGQHTDILNSKQVKKLITILNSEKRPGLTNWQYIVDTWNSNNSDYEIPYDIQMPDYSLLNS